MHAKNLVEGRAYSDIRYIPNPDAMWLSPANGYPPVYPMILAAVYRFFGLDLRAFKIATVLCFVGFLVIYAKMARDAIGWEGSICLLALVSFSPVFWEQRDFILSEFPYLLFSFAALLLIERVYARLEVKQIEVGSALGVSVLLYCAYGTRTIGFVLIFALDCGGLNEVPAAEPVFVVCACADRDVHRRSDSATGIAQRLCQRVSLFAAHGHNEPDLLRQEPFLCLGQRIQQRSADRVCADVYRGGGFGLLEEFVGRARRERVLSAGICRGAARMEF